MAPALPASAGAKAAAVGPARPAAGRVGLPRPAPVGLVVSPGLPGEGRWTPTGAVVHGVDAMYVAQFRADTVYTSQITSAVWIDPTLVRVALVPGAREPGGTWAQPPISAGAALAHGGGRLQRRVPLR